MKEGRKEGGTMKIVRKLKAKRSIEYQLQTHTYTSKHDYTTTYILLPFSKYYNVHVHVHVQCHVYTQQFTGLWKFWSGSEATKLLVFPLTEDAVSCLHAAGPRKNPFFPALLHIHGISQHLHHFGTPFADILTTLLPL